MLIVIFLYVTGYHVLKLKKFNKDVAKLVVNATIDGIRDESNSKKPAKEFAAMKEASIKYLDNELSKLD